MNLTTGLFASALKAEQHQPVLLYFWDISLELEFKLALAGVELEYS